MLKGRSLFSMWWCLGCVFFFKQKTAYEMRISDWSSDVCSSDLNDERVNATWPAYEAALKEAGVTYTLYQPAGTQHGFNNDTTPRYDEEAAAEAWRRTIALFGRTLREGAPSATR